MRGGAAVAAGLRVSVVVPTRDRPAHAAACVARILENRELFELIVVDQSKGSATEEALSAVRDARLRHVRSERQGVTSGRNVGIELSRGEIVAFTDDDCRVPPDWVSRVAAVFATDPEAAVVCGRVCVPDDILKRGFAVGFEPEVRDWRGRYPPVDRDWGITANLAMRRDLVSRVGLFDPVLGAGAPLRSGGEPDFLFRVLKAGFKVVNAREVQLDHLGFREPGPASAKLSRAYASGTAAAFLKHVRLGDMDAAWLFLEHLEGCGRLIFTNVVHRQRPIGLGYTLAFLSGALMSLRYRVNRATRLYVGR